MGINATLIGQMLTFALFVLFTMKFVWPPLIAAMRERQAKIADGLAAADRGAASLSEAKKEADAIIAVARNEAQAIVAGANKQATQAIEAAKTTASAEADRIKAAAAAEVSTAVNQAKEALRKEVASLAVAGAQKILGREINAAAHNDLLSGLAARI